MWMNNEKLRTSDSLVTWTHNKDNKSSKGKKKKKHAPETEKCNIKSYKTKTKNVLTVT